MCRQTVPDQRKNMWIIMFLVSYSVLPDDVGGQELLVAAPAFVVNLTLESEDGSYVDSRQITVTISPALATADPNSVLIEDTWTWTRLTEWSACSNTCGAGLQVAERFCVLVMGQRVVQAAATVDVCLDQDRQNGIFMATSAAGQASQKQFRKCEHRPCPATFHSTPSATPNNHQHDNSIDNIGPDQVPDFPSAEPGDLRFQLCSEFDDKEFAGDRKYTWIPFQTGYAPCALLCRPVEEKFYVSFAEKVPDGLSCEKIVTDGGKFGRIVSSSKGVCLNGTCQAIGCDGIIGAERHVDACGVCAGDSSSCQKIKIEFFEENLPKGHNKIGTIPMGACNISLTEQKPTGNVFALRTIQGFFLNGEWTASHTGDYAAAGTRFRYQHVVNGNSIRRHGERVTAKGPLREDIEIILITKKPNSGIILEYSISNKQDDSWQVPSRRHRADGNDNHIDTNAINYIQTGPHRGDIPSIAEDFVETPIHVESLPSTTAAPPVDRYVWSVAGYTACSKTCGKGIRQSNIVCVLERDRRILDDAYCENIIRPAVFQESCNLQPCAGEWHYGGWSECSVTCGMGSETREARCKQSQGDGVLADVSDEFCGAKPSHGIVRPCQRASCASYSWHSGEWSPCDATCGAGTQRRQVKCYDDAQGTEVGQEYCRNSRKPEDAQACGGGNCRGTWLFSDWTTKCSNECGTGTTSRHIVCFKDNRQQDHRMCEARERPESQQSCTSQKTCGGRWFEGPWSDCSADCGVGSQNREVICLRSQSYDRSGYPTCELLDESECKYHPKPETERQCQGAPCRAGSWFTSDWSPCSHSCGVGARSRQVACLDKNKDISDDCLEDAKPTSLESCGNDICPQDDNRRGAQRGPSPSYVDRPIDLNNKAGTNYGEEPLGDDRRSAYRPAPVFDINNKAGTLYDAQPENDDRRYARPPIDLNNKAGTLYDAAPQQDDRRYTRPPIDLNNKAGTLYDAQPENDDRRYTRPPIDLNNKAGTLYDAQPALDDDRYARPPIDLNNKAGTLYDAQPANDDRRYVRPPIDLNNKAGTLYDAAPQQDDRRYARPPIDLNNKAGTLYDAAPQQDARPPIDLNNKAGTLYDAAPQQDDRRYARPPIDLNNKAGTLYDAAPQQDARPPIDLNNKAGTLYDATPQQDDRRYAPVIDLNNKGPSVYEDRPPRPSVTSSRKGDAGVLRRRAATTVAPPTRPDSGLESPAARRRASGVTSNRVGADGRVDIDVVTQRPRNGKKVTTPEPHPHKLCVDKIDRCKTVKELAFCRYDYYKKMCCKSCSV